MPAHNRDVNFGPSRWRYAPDAFFMQSWVRVECKQSSAISVWSADSGTVTNARTASFFSLSRAPAWRAIKHFVMQMFRNNNSALHITDVLSASYLSNKSPIRGWSWPSLLQRRGKTVVFCQKLMKYEYIEYIEYCRVSELLIINSLHHYRITYVESCSYSVIFLKSFFYK